MSKDFRPRISDPWPGEPVDAMSAIRFDPLPEPIALPPDYEKPPAVEPVRFYVSPSDYMDRLDVALRLPSCTCRKQPDTEHHDDCPPMQYRLMQTGTILTLWSQAPGDDPHGAGWMTPKDCYVRTYQTADPRQYVVEITDPWAGAELWEAPPAWEFA